MQFTTLVVLAIAVVYSVNAITCPSCSDPNDQMTCTGTQDCHQDNDVCETRIDNHNNHRIEYHCAHAQNCADQENRNSCDNPTTGGNGGGHCVICCNSIADCRMKRNAYFAAITVG